MKITIEVDATSTEGRALLGYLITLGASGRADISREPERGSPSPSEDQPGTQAPSDLDEALLEAAVAKATALLATKDPKDRSKVTKGLKAAGVSKVTHLETNGQVQLFLDALGV